MSMTLLIMLLCVRATVMDIALRDLRFTSWLSVHLFISIPIHMVRLNSQDRM